MKKFDLKKGLLLLLLIFAATTYSQTANTIRLTSNGVAIGGLNPDEGTLMDQDDTVLTFDSAGVTTVNAADPDYTLGSNTGAVTFTDALSKSITVRLKAGLVVDQTVGSTYGAITTTGGIDRAGDGAIGVRPATGTTNWGIENGEGITFGFSTSNLPTSVTLQITRIYFSTFGLAESGVIVNRRDTSKKLDFTGPETGTNMIKDVASLGLYVRGGSTIYDMVSIFNNSSTVQSWRVTQIEFRLVETNSLTTVWNGSVWSAFTPGPTMDAVIEGNYSALASGGFSAKKLTINSGTLSIEATKAVKVDNEVINNAGPTGIVVYSGGGLRQVNNTVNTGAITVKRNSNPLSRLDSKAWSSPIANQNLLSFSPATLSTNFLNYNEGTNQFVSEASPSTTEFSTAGGYLIGMPDDAVTAPLTQTFEGNFIGITNNGDITKAITYGSSSSLGYNLVGNPYPSAIIANSFINANIANIDGSIYFYRKTSSTAGSAYAMYSRLGATNLVASSADTNAEIPVGEGFIVKAKNNANLTFTNAMRIASVPATLTANRVWLNLTNTAGVFSQALVGYVADGTLGVDNYDGKYINDSPVALTSNVNNEEYTIQGRPAFTPSDEVGLNFKTNQAGDYTIGVDRFDGVFTAGQEIYLKDNTTGTYTDLRTNSYTFTAAAGTDNSRFVLRYTAASYPIATTAGDNGSVSGAGTYDTYSTATLIATPSEGYGLVNWTENGIQVSASPTYTFTVTGARTLVANFGFTNVTDVTACASYTWNGTEYTASGVYVGQTIDGVVQKLNLTITAPTTIGSETISQCGGTYTWPVNNVTYSASTTEVVTVGCNTATLTLTLTPAPASAGADGSLVICTGTNVDTTALYAALTGTPATGGTWSATTGGAGTYTYTQAATSPCTTPNTATVTVTEQAAPNAGADGTLSVCAGTTPSESQLFAALTAADTGGTWTNEGLVYTYTVNAITPCNGSDTATVTVTVQAAPNAGTNGTLSLSASPSDEALFAALTGAATGGSWSRPVSGYVGVYTYTVNATAPCTVNATSTVTVTAATLLPAADTTYNLCAGAKISNLLAAATASNGSLGVKVYAAATGGTAIVLSGTTDAVIPTSTTPKAYWLTEPASTSSGESERVRVFAVVNALPATPSLLVLTNPASATPDAAVTAVGSFVDTNTPLKLTATAAGALSYKWTLPTGVVRTDVTGASTDNSITSADAFIYVKFTVTGVATPLVITVQSVNASGCASLVKATASLTRLLPTAPSALAMNDGNTLTAITTFAKYMGTSTVLRLSATAAATANSYLWELPEGVTRMTALSAGTTTESVTSTVPFIYVHFAGVTLENTATNATVLTTLTKVLRIGVKSVNGVGESITPNTALSNPISTSTAKLLTLTAVAPAAPSALALNNGVNTTAVTIISKLIGQEGIFRLSATASVLANRYEWTLPSCVTRVTSKLDATSITDTESTLPEIFIQFQQGGIATAGSVYFGVKAVNDIGASYTNNQASTVSPATDSTAKLLKLVTALPAAPGAIAMNDPAEVLVGTAKPKAVTIISKLIGSGQIRRLTATASVLANSYEWELPEGLTRVTDIGGSTNATDLESTLPEIFVRFDTNATAEPGSLYFGVKAVNNVGPSYTNNQATTVSPATLSTAKLLKLVTAPAATPGALALNNGENTTAITVISKLIGDDLVYRLSATASALANEYEWTLPDFVTRVTSKTVATVVPNNVSAQPEIFVRFDEGAIVDAGSVSFGVQAVNNVGSSSVAKTLSLVAALPATPAALALNNGDNTTAITVISKLIGNGLTYRLTATASPLANRYEWTLPDFVTRVTSKTVATEVLGLESTLPEIFVRFDAGAIVSAGSVNFIVSAVNNVGSSSVAKTLSLVVAAPAVPTAVVLSETNLATAITIASKLIGQGGTYKLTAAVPATTLANRFTWELPACVSRVTSATNATEILELESTDAFIFVKFDADATVTPGSITFGAKAVNNMGLSALKTVALTAALPVVVATITPATPLTVCNRANGYTYTITAPVGANYYEITAPEGSIVTSASNLGNDTNVLITADLIFTVVYDAFDTIDNKLVIKSMNNVGPSATSKLLTMVYTTTCPVGRSISDAPVAEDFSVVAYPNPSIEGFKVKSGNGKSFGVQVYDMLGRSIEQRQMNSDDQIGSNYASGIYNVIVNQGANVKTLRVIKQ